ncbi:hypothetical protein H4R19_005844, partial [Coemansia spiralis]
MTGARPDIDEWDELLEQLGDVDSDEVICISDSDSDGQPSVECVAEVAPRGPKRKAETPPPNQQQPQKQQQQKQRLPHPEGVVRLTQLTGERRDCSTWYTFHDVVQPGILRKAVLTTFVLDMAWLEAQLGRSAKLVVVKSYNPAVEPRGVFQSDGGRVTVVHPEFAGQRFPIMHSKLMLLFYDSYVRFVASSANLIEIDWTVLGNIVFIQDVPLDTSRDYQSTFGDSLTHALRDLGVPEQVVVQVAHMDFSAVAAEIVTSVPTAAGRSRFHAAAYGVQRLGQIARGLNAGCLADVFDPSATTVSCYGSSMGRLTHSYLCAFLGHLVGASPAELEKRTGRKPLDIERWVRVGFHTDEQGAANKFGTVSRHSIKCSRDNCQSRSFPRQVLHRIEPTVPGTLVHAKLLLVRTGRDQRR